MTDYLKLAETLQDEYLTKMQELAASYRLNVLVPLCREHRLEFVAGMGTFFFSPAPEEGVKRTYDSFEWSIGNLDDLELEEERQETDFSFLVEPLNFLNHEHESQQYMGFLIDDIRKEDY